ncbi:uncharacterized protein DEA37_0015198 [Paragonimus westermani]|uniref:Uncharacterized protein n=1 Tax=Paragonimus westermani TaxID=34504 RepID=A0A5J4P1C4_9TREM|nr:uncharacterized protein DEA37_0015198 [Paragonimus westermani]
MRIGKLLAITTLLLGVFGRKDSYCCLRGANICRCPRVYLLSALNTGCPTKLEASQLKTTQLLTKIDGTVPPGLYSLVAFSLDDLDSLTGRYFAWVVFLVVNIDSEKCLNSQNLCSLTSLTDVHISSCSAATGSQTRMNLFLLRQNRSLAIQDFNWDMDVASKWDMPPERHIMGYEIFGDPALYQRSPERGNQYELIKCRKHSQLDQITRQIDRAYGAEEIEAYLFTESLPFARRLHLSSMDEMIRLTERMMELEKIQCDLQQELRREHYHSSLHHVMRLCPEFDLHNLLQQVSEQQMVDTLRRLNSRAQIRLAELRQEYAILSKIRQLSMTNINTPNTHHHLDTQHMIDAAYARPYWKALYRATRISSKLELYAEIIYNVTKTVPELSLGLD